MQRRALLSVLAIIGLLAMGAKAQVADLREASRVALPPPVDGNSAAFWNGDRLCLFTSIGGPLMISEAADQFGPWDTRVVNCTNPTGRTMWMEGAWQDENGIVFGWYHHEPAGMVPGSMLTAPKIGAAISFDGGKTITDLGIILESGDPFDSTAQNGFFGGGHGDFSVIPDRQGQYLYFLFTNYGGALESQGIVVARMAVADRFDPVGKVYKYYQGEWNEPGLGGHTTPVYGARREWQSRTPDSLWGPSVHWNTFLNSYVILFNHAAGDPGWSQEGIYIAYATDLSQPATWAEPSKLLDRSALPGWCWFYPQVMGLEKGGTDTLAGQTARLYVNGVSKWEINFSLEPAVTPLRESKPCDPEFSGTHERFRSSPE